MSDWISHNRQLFLKDYTHVGESHEAVIKLQAEHSKFADNCMVSTGSYGACSCIYLMWGKVY